MKKLLIVLIILMPALTILGQTTKGKFGIYYFPMKGNIRPLLQIGAGYSTMSQKYTSLQSIEEHYKYINE